MRQKTLTPLNSLATLHPHLADQWHPTRNGDLTPDKVVAGSNKRVRAPRCPFCINKRVADINSLATLHPSLAAQWHPTKNGDLTPDKVVSGSNKRVWWKCGSDHEWEATIQARTIQAKATPLPFCPFCVNKRVSVTNSLATLHPFLAAQWHPTKNGDLTPDKVVSGSNKRVWWKCPKGPDHEWARSVNTRALAGSVICPFCIGDEISVTNSLATLHPFLAAQWHPTKNGDLTPDKVLGGGGAVRAWWKCSKGPEHEWESYVNNRVRGTGCPYCSGLRGTSANSLVLRVKASPAA